MNPVGRALLSLAGCLLGCGHGLHGIEGPAPDAPGAARIVALSSEARGSVSESSPSILLHAYDLHEACFSEGTLEEHYLGSLSLSRFEQEFGVAGGHYVLFRVVMSSYEGATFVGCKVEGGFVPRPGAGYRLDVSAFSTRACVLHATDEADRPVRLHPPVPC